MGRLLAGTVIINGIDDEIFGDELVHRTFNVQTVLDAGQPASVLEVPPEEKGMIRGQP